MRGVNLGSAYLSKRYYHHQDLIAGCRADLWLRYKEFRTEASDLTRTQRTTWKKTLNFLEVHHEANALDEKTFVNRCII